MTKNEMMGLASEAGLWVTSVERLKAVEKFTELVAAAERKRIESRPWGAGEEWIARAVAAEREACANVADEHMDGTPEWNSAANNIASAIRARGQG